MKKSDFLKWIAQLTGKAPGDEELYIRAITHGSFGEQDYQRLEFLGDRVLGLTIAAKLYQQFPKEPEGKLSQRLNGLVSGKMCAEIAGEIGISDHILLGKQARDDGARKSSKVLGDIMESLIGAVYLDHGIETASEFILKYWNGKIAGMTKAMQHPKSELQEWTAAQNWKTPHYELVEKSGPHHDLRFTVKVSVSKVGEAQATASSIQTAETEAAKAFLGKFT